VTILTRLEQWKEQGKISSEQYAHLASFSRAEPFSLFLELNILLYAGVLAFVAGLGWTVSTWSQQLGNVLILAVLSAILAASFWYCFSRGPEWSPAETAAPSAIFDYVLYLGSLVWSLELGYIENRFHVLSGKWDLYLLASAVLFFFLAYRFDNRLVLSLCRRRSNTSRSFTAPRGPISVMAGSTSTIDSRRRAAAMASPSCV
jgi:hypothetical protein